MFWGCCRGPISDWRVRKAIKMALNYTEMVDEIMLGAAVADQSQFPPGVEGWEVNAHYFPGGDVDGANALLDEAGYPVGPDGWRFDMEIDIRPRPRWGVNFIDLTTLVKAQLAKIGINVKIAVYEIGEWYDRMMDFSRPEAAYIGPGGWSWTSHPGGGWTEYFVMDEMNPYNLGWNSTSSGNDVNGKNIWLTAHQMYLDARAELDPELRKQKWLTFDAYYIEYGPQQLLFATAYPTAWLDSIHGAFPSVTGLFPSIFWITKS